MALILVADRQYTAPSAANAVSLTPSGVAWTNSAYVTILDPTPTACVLTGITLYTTDGTGNSVAYDAEIDIATGAAGAEVVITTFRVYNKRIFSGGQTGQTHAWALPVPVDNIGAGVRLSARMRKNNTNLTVWKVAITYFRKPLASSILTTAGVQKALPPASASLTLTAGSPAWTNGSWVQLRSNTGAALVITGVVCNVASLSAQYEIDLGTGAASAETVITTLRVTIPTTWFSGVFMLPTPLDNVAASTRVAARVRSSTASTTLVVSLMVLEQPL